MRCWPLTGPSTCRTGAGTPRHRPGGAGRATVLLAGLLFQARVRCWLAASRGRAWAGRLARLRCGCLSPTPMTMRRMRSGSGISGCSCARRGSTRGWILPAAEQRVDWAQWMTREVRDADRVLVVASPEYRRRAEGDAGPDEGRGVQWEARLIRDRFYADQDAGLQLVLPVVLPGCSADGHPVVAGPGVGDALRGERVHGGGRGGAAAGADRPAAGDRAAAWGTVPLPAAAAGHRRCPCRGRPVAGPGAADRGGDRGSPVPGTGRWHSAVWLAGSLLCQRQAPLPAEVAGVWGALRLPALVAGGPDGGGGPAAGRGAAGRGRAAGAGRAGGPAAARRQRWRWC